MTTTSAGPAPAHHEQNVRLAWREPFSWAHSLRFICGFPATRNEQEVTGDRLVKGWRFGDVTVVTAIRPAVGEPALDVDLAATAQITDDLVAAVTDRLSFFLSLTDDLTEFERTARADPGFAPVAARMRGYHQVKFASPLENLVWSILAQRNPMPVAREAKQRLMQALNTPVEAFGATFLPFPTLQQLAGLSPGDLAEITRNERKATYLHGTVQKLLDIDETWLRTADHREVQEALLSLPGIGPWSATFVLIRGLGRMELLPQDKEILQAASKAYGRPLTEADLVSLSAPYAPNQGYWAHYLRAGQ